MMRIVLMLGFFICCSTGGEIAMTYGMKRVGEPKSFHPMDLLRFLGKAIRNGWVWLAMPLHGGIFLFAHDSAFLGAYQSGYSGIRF